MSTHARLLKLGLDTNPVTATQLLKAYIIHPSPSSLRYAHRLFDQVPPHSRDSILWTTLITAYAQTHHPIDALRLFSHMLSDPPRPNAFTLASAARAAASIGDPLMAGPLHTLSIKLGVYSHVVVSTSIIDMHSKCGDLISSCKVFDEMPYRNNVTWNSMVAGYANAGMGIWALELFYQMRCVEVEVGCDEFSVASGLTACAGLTDLRSGMQIHGYLVSAGLEQDPAVQSAKANMYFRCGDVESAERVMVGREESIMFKLMMIKGYVFNELYEDAIRSICRGSCFGEVVMRDSSVVVPILTACANLSLLGIGRQMHGLIVTMGGYDHCRSLSADNVVFGCALIDMYCKCCSINEARRVFDTILERHTSHWNSMIMGFIHNDMLEEARGLFEVMPDKIVISWTAIISGYINQGLPLEGLRLLARLHSENGSIRGNCFTFATAINACSCLAALDMGKQIHAQSLRTISESDIDNVVVETALVDMYSKTGSLNYGRKLFDRMQKKNVVSWTSMINGYSSHGLGSEAIEILEQMMRMGYKPNEVTFVAILCACSHCGLVDQGIHYFRLMRDKYGIAPRGDHYACMVDMLARAGRLVEAWNLVEGIKGQGRDFVKENVLENDGGAAIQGALLGGCRLHANVEIGGRVAKEMLNRKHQVSDTYLALSNVYAAAEMWEQVYDVREQWRQEGVLKEAGHSQIQG